MSMKVNKMIALLNLYIQDCTIPNSEEFGEMKLTAYV